MSKPASKTAALAVVELDELTPDQIRTSALNGANLMDTLGKRAREELDAIQRLECETAKAEKEIAARRQEISLRGLIFGAVLCQIKPVLGHGKFGAWKREHLGGERNRQANYLMKLAAVFVRAKGVLLPEVLALPQTTLDLAGGPKEAASAIKKAKAFVGQRSLNELLELHGVKMRGGYHPSEIAVEKWLRDFHPKLVGKAFADLDEELQLAFKQSGYNERDWRTPAQIKAEQIEAAKGALHGPVQSLLGELDRTEWRAFVGPKDLLSLRRELQDAIAKIDRITAEMEGRS